MDGSSKSLYVVMSGEAILDDALLPRFFNSLLVSLLSQIARASAAEYRPDVVVAAHTSEVRVDATRLCFSFIRAATSSSTSTASPSHLFSFTLPRTLANPLEVGDRKER